MACGFALLVIFLSCGIDIGMVPRMLFYWRQHSGQQTRSHGRLSVSDMRKCKCEFLCMDGGPIWPESSTESVTIEIWRTGQTLDGWVDDLSFELNRQGEEAVVIPQSLEAGRGSSIGGRRRQCTPVSSAVVFVREGERKATSTRDFCFGLERCRLYLCGITIKHLSCFIAAAESQFVLMPLLSGK